MSLTRENNYYCWDKGETNKLSPSFVTTEFACKCSYPSCKQQLISVELVEKLQKVRETLGVPVKITSGYRCAEHQAYLATQGFETAPGISQHVLGNAADVTSSKIYSLGNLLKEQFKAIGEASNWFHVDTRADRSRYWIYKKRI